MKGGKGMADKQGRLTQEEVLSRVNIVSLISEFVPLKKQGANYVGLCPFHADRNPSLFVSESKGIFKCFACGVGGNAIRFIELSEKLSYVDALYNLADRAGIKYTRGIERDEQTTRLRNDIRSLNKETAKFYFEQLKTSRKAQEYLKTRGITADTATKFGLGYSPDSWDALYKYFKSGGVQDDLLIKAGLVSKTDKGNLIDRFRDRLMFPIFDDIGNVIAFGGRTMDKDAKTAKYINSQETPIYIKGQHLYGLNIAKKSVSDKVIIVEGYMDCIALHQKGIDFAVAALGTALTEKQGRLLKRYFEKREIIVAFDNDSAGAQATVRGMEILKNIGLSVKVFRLTGAKDADEFLKTHTKDDFLEQLSHSYSLFEYKCILAAEENPADTNEHKIDFINKVKSLFAQLPDTDKLVYKKWVTEKFGKQYGFGEDTVAGSQSLNQGKADREEPSNGIIQRRIYISDDEKDDSGLSEADKKKDFNEKRLLICFAENPGVYKTLKNKDIRGLFTFEENRLIFDIVSEGCESGEIKGFSSLPSFGAAADNRLAEAQFKYDIKPSDAKASVSEMLQKLYNAAKDAELDRIQKEIDDPSTPKERKIELVKKFAALKKKQKK
jgi:DNA primase